MRTGGSLRWSLLTLALALALAAPAAALAAFPGSDPDESPRLNTPDDPDFDDCEGDDEQGGPQCSYFDEEFRAFGFSPDTALLAPPLPAHPTYLDCPVDLTGTAQLDPQGRQANTTASEGQECSQIAGVRADTAFKYFGKYGGGANAQVGSDEVAVAVLDTGIRWQESELQRKVRLNAAELPTPGTGRPNRLDTGGPCAGFTAADDANNDGVFNVTDFACDADVEITAGDDEADGSLDPSDLIAEFSFGSDEDSNGFVDDIAGWDFFDDDNDPFDASSCCSASGHGTGRAREAVAETDNGEKGVGMCPDCQLIPLRVWDTFVVPTDYYAMGVDYATRNGASVVEGAVGGLTNTQFARRVFERADQQGVSLMLVSSDINSANHNYPTNYNEAVYVAGSLPDTAPFTACNGLGSLPLIGDLPTAPPQQFIDGCNAFQDQIDDFVPLNLTGQPTTSSFFRNSNLTQYGGKADIVMMGSTGSENTGQASGAAGLIHSFGRLWLGPGGQGAGPTPDVLSGNEVRQLLTMSAEDVQPENTGTIGSPDRANEGWDTHFGYGRVNLANALARISNDPVGTPASPPVGWPCDTDPGGADPVDPNCIPPEAQLDAPDWFAPINVDRVPAGGVPIKGRVAGPHTNSSLDWEVEYACGQQPAEADYQPLPGGNGTGAQPAGTTLATIPKATLETLATSCDGSVTNDAGRPAGTAAQAWPADPYPSPDPERHAFQVRLTVAESDDPGNMAQYHKTLFAYENDGNLDGWPKPVGSGANADDLVTAAGGESSQRLYDVNGDNELDVVQATSSGELWVLGSDGNPVGSFNGGQPVRTDPYLAAQSHGVGAGLPTPRETPRTPVIGDVDGDLEADIVLAAGEHVYAWDLEGDSLAGFPVRLDPSLSEPCQPPATKPCFHPAERRINEGNHIKRGILGSPALADLTGGPALEIVVAGLDQHIHAFDGDGADVPGFPRRLDQGSPDDGAEIITSPAIAELDGDPRPEIVASTNEVVGVDPAFPASPFSLLNVFINTATGSNPVYAINDDGTDVAGSWPAEVGVAAGDLLPLVLPGHESAVADIDDDGVDEVSISAGTSLAGQGSQLVDGTGTTISTYENAAADTIDQGPVLNLADYTSVGNVSGLPNSLWAVKGGLTVNGAANLLAVNQNLPYSHVEQAWEIGTGSDPAPAAPGYPRATDDFQLLSNAAISRVSGSGPGRQILVGTGMYQLHAYDSLGEEAADWPKFTGGWTQPTPAVGDADGDGDLDVTGATREGWSFLWDTDGVDACESGTPASTTNEEWWTARHDEHGTGNYGTDSRPPGTPEGLTAQRSGSTVTLDWTAPGDDWMCGTADVYRVVGSSSPITGATDGTQIGTDEANPGASGDAEQLQLSDTQLGGAQYVAVLYRDEAGNWGLVKSIQVPAAGAGGSGDGDGGGGGSGGDGGGANPTPPVDPPPDAGPCANVLRGTSGDDKLTGTAGSDRIAGRAGADRIRGGAGDDCLSGGRGIDRISGGSGDDRIHVRGGRPDRVKCGPGRDTVIASRTDNVTRSCERVRD